MNPFRVAAVHDRNLSVEHGRQIKGPILSRPNARGPSSVLIHARSSVKHTGSRLPRDERATQRCA